MPRDSLTDSLAVLGVALLLLAGLLLVFPFALYEAWCGPPQD